jgi:hypothetical protein
MLQKAVKRKDNDYASYSGIRGALKSNHLFLPRYPVPKHILPGKQNSSITDTGIFVISFTANFTVQSLYWNPLLTYFWCQ